MKRLFILFCIICIGLPVFSGQAQQQYEKQNAIDVSIIKNHTIKELISYQHQNLLRLYNLSDEANFSALKIIKKNFEKCQNISCWEYVDIDDYTYKFLDDDNKFIIMYNNAIYKNK